MSDSHVYFISGGTGSLGTELSKHLLAQGHKVRAYARNEHSHEKLARSIPAAQQVNFSSLIGAVEDSERLKLAMRNVRYVIHAAAQKAISLAEYNPLECLKTNIGGSANVMRAALEAGVERAILVSTDKAAAPNTLYGASKMCAERLWLAANRYSAGQGTDFVAVRYGNVWGSQGSVIKIWSEQSAVHAQLKITDPESTRFHITLGVAVELVVRALLKADRGTLWIPKLPSYKLADLATAFHRRADAFMPDLITGLRPGEKRHEDLISENESGTNVESQATHYVLDPARVVDKGGWSYSSGSNPWKLGVTELEKEIRAWASSS